MAFSREIIKKVLQYVRFRVPQTEEKNSYYTEIGNTLVRVSNHCTWLYRWDEILEKNPKWKGKPIVSIVFEDSGNTFSNKCLVLRRFRMKPIKVMEYVYPLQGNPQFITPQDERLIINGIKQIQGGKYTDLTNKCSEPILRISQNPPDVPPTKTMNNNENKQYKSNTNMNKKLIRLTESDLHRIVKESVNRILREASYNINSPEYKQMYDNGNRWPDEMDDTALTNREISDYEALPDRARHPYGQDFPNFSDRIANRAPVTPKDKLASKRPNSVLDMQNKKRALNGMDPATAEHIRRNRDKEENDMIKYGYAGY